MFTLASSKAADKMARYLLPEPEMWVLKVVQAAVRAKADKLEFKFGRNKTTVRLAGGEAWSLLELKGSLESLDSSIPSHGELMLGLRSLASTHDFILRDEKGDRLRFVDEVLSYSENGRSSAYSLQMEVRRRKRKSEFRQWLRERIHEHASSSQWLQSRARFAPLILRVDGRTLSSAKYECKPPSQDGMYDDRKFETPLLWAGLTTNRPLHAPKRLKVANKRILSDPLMSERFFATYEESDSELPRAHLILAANCSQTYRAKEYLNEAPFADYVWVTIAKPSNFRVHVSRYGVVCDSFRARASLGGELHLPCDHLDAGITGFERRQQQTVLEEARDYLQGLSSLLEELQKRIVEHQPSSTLPRPNANTFAKAAAVLGFTTLGFSGLWGLNLLAAGKVGLATGSGLSAAYTLRARQLDRDGVEEIARAVTQFKINLASDGLQFQRF